MYVVAYYNTLGALRVDNTNHVMPSMYEASRYAEFCAHGLGRPVFIIDCHYQVEVAERKARKAGTLTPCCTLLATTGTCEHAEAQYDYEQNHQHIMGETPDGYGCRICYTL